MSDKERILIVRSDRLGDVLLALPSILHLKRTHPDCQLDFCFPSALHDVLRPTLESLGVGLVSIEEGSERIDRYRAVLFLFAPAAMIRRAAFKRVPIRIGPYSKLSSFLFFSSGLRQKRSQSEKNESHYNWDLMEIFSRKIGRAVTLPMSPVELKGDVASAASAASVVKALGVQTPFCVVHPGMGGSALNLSAESYVRLIQTLAKHRPIVLSIGPSEKDQALKGELVAKIPLPVIEGQPLSVLREIFRLAETVVAPSTGPLHLAHLVGTKAVGLFPPVLSQRAERWAPSGGKVAATALMPSHPCPGTRDCIGSSCPEYFCMDRWNWAAGLPF